MEQKKKTIEDNNDEWLSFIAEFKSVIDITVKKHTEVNHTEVKPNYLISKLLNINLERNIDFTTNNRSTQCISCNKPLYVSSNMLICKSCGIELPNASNATEDEYSTAAIEQCNVNSKGFIGIKFTGKGSYRYQKCILKTCANYKKYRKNNILKDIKNWNIHSTKQHIPKDVINMANNMFATIKEHEHNTVFRKDNKKGVIAACLYYACHLNGISKTPLEMAEFVNIEEKFLSFGDRVLRDLNERGIITITVKINPIADYVDRYLTMLSIDTKYRQFILDIIDRAERARIHILNDSKNISKAVGSIYLLIERVPELRARITKELIEETCRISKTTFMRYYLTLCEFHKHLKKVFKKHRIPMKHTWKKIINI